MSSPTTQALTGSIRRPVPAEFSPSHTQRGRSTFYTGGCLPPAPTVSNGAPWLRSGGWCVASGSPSSSNGRRKTQGCERHDSDDDRVPVTPEGRFCSPRERPRMDGRAARRRALRTARAEPDHSINWARQGIREFGRQNDRRRHSPRPWCGRLKPHAHDRGSRQQAGSYRSSESSTQTARTPDLQRARQRPSRPESAERRDAVPTLTPPKGENQAARPAPQATTRPTMTASDPIRGHSSTRERPDHHPRASGDEEQQCRSPKPCQPPLGAAKTAPKNEPRTLPTVRKAGSR